MGRVREMGRWSAGEAQEVLDAWKRSGLPLARFARQQGYGAQRLQWWKRRLGGRSTTGVARLVPVELPGTTSGPISSRGSAWIEIALPDGVRLRVPEAVDPRSVGRLIAALREARC